MMTKHTYLNFDLSIELSQAGYRSRILFAPSGQGKRDFVLPFSREELQAFLPLSNHAMDRLRLISHETESTTPLTPQRFGEQLFDAAFSGDVGIGLLRSLDEAKRRDAGLRIRLQLDDGIPELAELPWEYLYARPLNRFLLLSNQTVLVRYLALAHQIKPLPVTDPLHILIIVSDPSDVVQLNVETEWTRVTNALQPLQADGLITLEQLDQPTLAGLQNRLQQTPSIHIIHFIGHGYFDEVENIGGLLLETEAGQAQLVDAAKLATLLIDHSSLRLIFLNSCDGARSNGDNAFAGTAQRLISQGIPAVLAMQFSMSDEVAITLAQTFYRSTANGYPVDAALAEARKSINLSGNEEEWATPVLFSRADDNQIFISPGDHEDKPPVQRPYKFLSIGVLAILVVIVLYRHMYLPPSSELTPSVMTVSPTLSTVCEYAVIVRDLATDAPIANAKLTLEYQLDSYPQITNSEGRYRGEFSCTETRPSYMLRVDAAGYLPYTNEFILQSEFVRIYLIPRATPLCHHLMTVLDMEDLTPIGNAKVQIELGLYYTTDYTNSEGYYAADLPCTDESSTTKVRVYAPGYETYTVDYDLNNEIQEIRLKKK